MIGYEIRKIMNIPGAELTVIEKNPEDDSIRQYAVSSGINAVRYCITDLMHRDESNTHTFTIWIHCNAIKSFEHFEMGMYLKKVISDVLTHEGDAAGFMEPNKLLEILD